MTFNEVIKESVSKNCRVEISYKSYNQENSIRQLSNVEYSNEFQKHHGNNYDYISAYCHLRNDKRTFKLDRIEKIRLVVNSYNSDSVCGWCSALAVAHSTCKKQVAHYCHQFHFHIASM